MRQRVLAEARRGPCRDQVDRDGSRYADVGQMELVQLQMKHSREGGAGLDLCSRGLPEQGGSAARGLCSGGLLESISRVENLGG